MGSIHTEEHQGAGDGPETCMLRATTAVNRAQSPTSCPSFNGQHWSVAALSPGYAFCIRPSTTRSPSPSLRTSLSVPDIPDKPTNKDTYKLGQIPRSTSTKSGTACHQTSWQYMRLTCSRQRSAATSFTERERTILNCTSTILSIFNCLNSA